MFKTISILTTLFIALQVPVSGQSGKFLIGGSMGFSYSSDKVTLSIAEGSLDSKTISFSGSPLFGYFISNNFMTGIEFEFSTEKTKSQNYYYSVIRTRALTINPLARYYFNSPFFAEARFIWGPSSSYYKFEGDIIPGDEAKSNTKTLGFGVGAGYDIKLADKIFLEPLVYYKMNTNKSKDIDGTAKQSHIIFNLGIIVRI